MNSDTTSFDHNFPTGREVDKGGTNPLASQLPHNLDHHSDSTAYPQKDSQDDANEEMEYEHDELGAVLMGPCGSELSENRSDNRYERPSKEFDASHSNVDMEPKIEGANASVEVEAQIHRSRSLDQNLDVDKRFQVLAKNCRGLKSADRVDELLGELREQEWGAQVLYSS